MRIKIDLRPLQKALRGIERQSKFGTSQALNELVEVIKLRSIDRLPKYFKIRSGYLARGFKTTHAKRDMLIAAVGHKDEFMKAQAEGGKKAPSGTALFGQGIPQVGTTGNAIPMPRGMSGERPTYRGANWPKQLINAVKKFEARLAGSRTKKRGTKSQIRAQASADKTRAASNRLVFLKNAVVPTIAIRIGSGNGRGKYLPLWFLKNSPVNIPKRWMFYEDGESFAKSNLPPLMDWHITKSLNMIGRP